MRERAKSSAWSYASRRPRVMETGQVNERFHAEKEMVMETLFVIGAGTMGGGIAQVAALNGFTVYLYDIKQEFVDKGLKGIVGAWDKLVARGKMAAEDRDAALPRIVGTLDMQDAAKADVVIEAAVEDLDVKRSIFSKLDGIVSPGCILATNTSSLSVTAVASAVGQPRQGGGPAFLQSRAPHGPHRDHPRRRHFRRNLRSRQGAFRTAGQNGGHRE